MSELLLDRAGGRRSPATIIEIVHARRAPMIPVSATLGYDGRQHHAGTWVGRVAIGAGVDDVSRAEVFMRVPTPVAGHVVETS